MAVPVLCPTCGGKVTKTVRSAKPWAICENGHPFDIERSVEAGRCTECGAKDVPVADFVGVGEGANVCAGCLRKALNKLMGSDLRQPFSATMSDGWHDWDGAKYELAIALGIVPEPDPVDRWKTFRTELKGVFWSNNPVGNALHEILEKLVEADILRKKPDDDDQYGWNPEFDLHKAGK